MGLALCILGFAGVAFATRRSLGDGLGLLLTIGAIYGIARCQIFDGFTHFLFDASVLGAYLGGYTRLREHTRTESGALRSWLLALSALPLLLILLSPLLDAQPVPVQLLGLRPALLFLPLMLLGAAATDEDWRKLALWAAFVALGSALVMVGEYYWGVEPFFPVNDASKIIYLSQDVGEAGQYRLPSVFSSAHAYGGTMVALLPLLIVLVELGGWKRRLGMAALAAAVLGIFACGARSPVLWLGFFIVAISARMIKRPALALAVLLAGLVVGIVVPRESRFQRFETLSETADVQSRVSGSVNLNFLDLVTEYPLGRGLGSALGTSIPYFLAAEAKPQIGMENEYVRIAIEQGILGVLLWMSFITWVLLRSPGRLQRLGGVADIGIWASCAFSWAQGFIGTGLMASVPGTMILMIYMGFLSAINTGPEPRRFVTVANARLARPQGA